MDSFIGYLTEKYGQNEPIFSDETDFGAYSKAWINKALAELCESGKLIRFEKGVYYVPKETLLGLSVLDPMKVITKKYIIRDGVQSGYYSGVSFLNQLGLSLQVPNTLEIYTNSEMSKVRERIVGGVKVLLRHPRTPVDNGNAAVQSLLEMMNSVTGSFFDEERRKTVAEYIRKNGITKRDITKYAAFFPDKAIRTLVESEVIYSVAS